MAKLTKTEETALRFIGEEARPCQCQFRYSAQELSTLVALGLISIVPCELAGHGTIVLTDTGRSALASTTAKD